MPVGTIRWWEQFQQDFAKMFPETTFYNGAVSAMDSRPRYQAYSFHH